MGPGEIAALILGSIAVGALGGVFVGIAFERQITALCDSLCPKGDDQ